jgi:hypothetical protein
LRREPGWPGHESSAPRLHSAGTGHATAPRMPNERLSPLPSPSPSARTSRQCAAGRSARLESGARSAALALLLALGCAHLTAPTQAQTSEHEEAKHADAALAQVREDEKLADDVELALGQRWQGIAAILQGSTQPLPSSEDVLRARGLPDPEAGLAAGVFSRAAVRRRYFVALWLGWQTEASAMTVAARLEANRLASLLAARDELPDVEQRLVLDQRARAASDRLHALCQRLSTLGGACSDALLGRDSLRS